MPDFALPTEQEMSDQESAGEKLAFELIEELRDAGIFSKRREGQVAGTLAERRTQNSYARDFGRNGRSLWAGQGGFFTPPKMAFLGMAGFGISAAASHFSSIKEMAWLVVGITSSFIIRGFF